MGETDSMSRGSSCPKVLNTDSKSQTEKAEAYYVYTCKGPYCSKASGQTSRHCADFTSKV
jgi:hypothetical protein